MMLADMGADIIRVDRMSDEGRPGTTVGANPRHETLNRGRRSVALNLKRPEAIEAVLRLCEAADALIEGFRPGVMERLGLGPDICLGRNPRLVYGRMTGWGQEGPLSKAAGHDINYISLSGVLHAIGRKGQRPVPPLNLLGDYGGGGMLLAFGVVCGIVEAQRSGRGQVIDAAMVDGAPLLMTAAYGLLKMGRWDGDRHGVNLLDTGAHFYDVYETKDGKYISVGSIEPQFYKLLIEKTGLDPETFKEQMNRERWPEYKEKIEAVFKTKTQDEWCRLMENTDVCFAPVLSMNQARHHPHLKERGTFIEVEGVLQPGPAPRFSRTLPGVQRPSPRPGEHNDEALKDWGIDEAFMASLKQAGVM